MDMLSLEKKCPYTLKAIMYLVWTLKGYKCPFARPTKWLYLKYLLELARDKEHSVALTMVVQNMPLMEWTSLPDTHDVAKSFSVLHNDVVTLLGYGPTKHVGVVDKI